MQSFKLNNSSDASLTNHRGYRFDKLKAILYNEKKMGIIHYYYDQKFYLK